MPNIAIPAETPVIKSWRRHITASINAIKNAIALYALNVTTCERNHILYSALIWLLSL